MAEPNAPKKNKKKPPSTADILKKIRQKKQAKTVQPSAQRPKAVKKKPTVVPKQTPKGIGESKNPVATTLDPPQKRVSDPPAAKLKPDELPAFLDTAAEPPAFLSNTRDAGEESFSPTRQRKRFVPSKVIPKIQYQRMKALLYKRGFYHVLILFCLAFICGTAIVWVVKEFEKRSLILRGVNEGIAALETNQPETAHRLFQQTLDRYQTFRVGFTKHLWFIDGQTELAVIQMALGWGQLGEFRKGIQSFQQVFLHDPFSTHPWMKERITQQIIEFIQPHNWDQTEMQNMYGYLLQLNPEDWQVGAYFVPLMTEWVGMHLYPLQERFDVGYDVVYGKPIRRNADNTFTVQAELFYKQDVLPGTMDIRVPLSLTEADDRRLDWYMGKDSHCLFFCRESNGSYVLDGIQGIAMNSPYFMEAFAAVVEAYNYDNL